MKIAVLSDIHGNSAALTAVLQAARECNVSRLFILGDLVGYYYHPGSVMKLLESWPRDVVQGNHERMLQEAALSPASKEQLRKRYGRGLDCVFEQLEPEELHYLLHLPEKREITIDGMRFLLCHGAPWDRDCYVYPDAPPETLRNCVVTGSDVVLMGHTHYPFFFNIDGCTVANAGSVGQARDQGSMASWLLIDTSNRTFVSKHTNYNSDHICAEVKLLDPDVPYLHQVLKRGHGTVSADTRT